jgi:hypothetical protein
MIQTRMTGSTISCLWPRQADHARMPVTMPRNSDSDMCRDGSSAASEQSKNAVDEHGRVYSVSDLDHFAPPRATGSNRVPLLAIEETERWRVGRKSWDQIRGQDKRRAIQRHLCGWFKHVILYGTSATTPYLNCKTLGNVPSLGMAHRMRSYGYGF